ncbi:MAG: hypothetical protein GTN78_09375 [Gemmatimonadales bacterium]|nr:hypothetical protein [Gemmatimonadales bacterium]
MKRVVFFVLGAAVGFIVSGTAIANASTMSDRAGFTVLALATIFGGAIGSSLAGRARKEVEGGRTSGVAKVIVWLLAFAIIAAAAVAFWGLNR